MDHRWITFRSLVEPLKKDSLEGTKAKKRRKEDRGGAVTRWRRQHVGACCGWAAATALMPAWGSESRPSTLSGLLEARGHQVLWKAGAECREEQELERGPQSERGAFSLLCTPFPAACAAGGCITRGFALAHLRQRGKQSLEEKRMGGRSEKANDLIFPYLTKVPVNNLCTHRTSVRFLLSHFKIWLQGMSLEAQWLRLCFCSREHGFDPWTGSYDPTCCVLQRKQY